jgi:hypothetical protein
MADPQVATKLTPAEWGTQFRQENPNYFRYQDITDPAEFADAMRSTLDIDSIVDFSEYDMEMTPTGSMVSKIPIVGGAIDAALNIGTRKPQSIMVDGEETAVGAHIFGDDSKAWYTGQRFISGIPTFIAGQVAGGFDEQSAYAMVTESITKDGSGNPILDENGMMDWVDGSGNIHKVTKEDMLERADKLRSSSFLPFGIGPNWKEAEEWLTNKTIDFWTEHKKRQDEYLINNPGVQGYLQWQKETPFSYEDHGVRQFVHPQMIARAVADMLPSMTVGTLLGGAPGAVRQTFGAAIGTQTVKQGLKNLTVGSFAQVGGMTLMEGSGQMEESLDILVNELKMDPGQAVPIAASTALVVGITNGLLEKLQFTKIAKYGAFDDQAKTLLTSTVLRKFYDDAMKAGGVAKWMSKGGEFLVDNIEEGVIEAMQEINGLAMSKALESGHAATPEEAMDLYHRQFSNMENMKEMASSPEALQAFFTGTAGGGGMSAGTKGISYLMGNKDAKDQVTIGVDEDSPDGKPGILVGIGGKIKRFITKDKDTAKIITSTVQKKAEDEGFAVPELNKNIEDISTMGELLIALAHQSSDGRLGAIARIWDKGNRGRSKDHQDLTDAQIILNKLSKDNRLMADVSQAIQMVIDKAGIGVLDEIQDESIKNTIISELRINYKREVKSSIAPGESGQEVGDKADEFLDKALEDNDDFIKVYNDETEFTNQLNEFLEGNVDTGATYQSSKAPGPAEQQKIDEGNARRSRVKDIFLDPNKGWDVKDLAYAAQVAFEQRGINGLKAFLGGTQGTKSKPGFRGLTKMSLKVLMDAYGLKYTTKTKREDMISALMKAMAKQAVSEINIKTSQKDKPAKKKPKTTAQKMDAFFGEEESTPVEDPIETKASEIQAEIDKLERALPKMDGPGATQLKMAIGALRKQQKQLSLGTKPKPKVEVEPKKEKITEEEVKTDTGETITITPTGEGVTPASAVAKGLDMIDSEDASNFADESAQELNEDNYDNVEEETDDISDIINNCGRGI